MKTRTVDEFLTLSMGVLLVLSVWSAAPIAQVSATGLVTFSLSDGDNVTCYPIEYQKSLNGSKKYNRYPTTEIIPGNNTYDNHGSKLAQQTMAAEVGACPDGTIPIRAYRGIWGDNDTQPWMSMKRYPASADIISPPHEYAVAWGEPQTPNATCDGTELYINVWKPYVQSTYEFSLTQLWLGSQRTNTMEAGSQVSPGHFGDGLPRLFTYWTADSYATTGCYELTCPGFVQVSNKVLLGGSFASVSRQAGQQYEIKLRVFKDDRTGDWWLQLNDEIVGYWPKDIYNATTPFDSADFLSWGAELVDNEPADGGLHTHTQMGSGKFANKGYGRAAYVRNLQYIWNNTLFDSPFFTGVTLPLCYSLVMGSTFQDWGSSFFFGGPGYGPRCLHDPAYTPPPPPSGAMAPAPAPTAGG